MKYKSQISILLVIALIMGCMGWTPATAQQIRKDNTAPSAPEAMNMESLVEDTQILDYVDSEQFLQADHVARLPQEETLDSYVFLNRDGTRSVYYMGRPVKYVDENGTIHEKDTTLVRSKSGYGMRDNDVALHIPDAAATGITLSHNQRSIKLTPQGGSGTAQMADNSIDYVNFFGKGTILRYTPMLSGMKEDIILAEYTGQNSFTFLLETNGLNLYQDQGRYYLAESQDVEATFYLGQIDVYDAIGRPDLGTMTVETIVPGQRYRLTVSADEEFLKDPETVYPVTIDPTLTVRDSEEVRGTLEDTPVFSNYPIRNFGNYTFNSMGYVEGFGTAMTAVRLTSLLADTNYAQLTADQLNSVTFHIKSAGGSYANISVHALTENSTWTEMGLTWNTLGAYTETAYATQAMGNVLWDAFNITNLAKEWKNGTQNPQCGFVLISDSTTIRTATYGGEYGTIDYRPYVVVNYSNAITLDQTSTSVYEGNTVTLTATTIPAGQAVTWESDASAIASVSDTGVVTGQAQGNATITAKLADGTSVNCEIEVLEKSINFGYTTDIEVYKGNAIELTANTEPAGEPVTWTSLNPDIATVENGVVTGISAGEATIRASLGDGTYADCEVVVLPNIVNITQGSVTIIKDPTMDPTVTLIAETVPPGLPVTWSSSDPTVATVSPSGVVTALKAGDTTITATLWDGTSDSCIVKVRYLGTLNRTTMDLIDGDGWNLVVDASGPIDVTWTSSNTAIATVAANGYVRAQSPGTAYITANSPDLKAPLTCEVNVRIIEGLYRIVNCKSRLDLTAKNPDDGISNLAHVIQKDTHSNANIAESFSQYWKICYLGNGYYTLRPAHKLNLCLYMASNGEVVLVNVYDIDDPDEVSEGAQWNIKVSTLGYTIENRQYSNYSLMPEAALEDAGVRVTGGAAAGNASRWSLRGLSVIPTVLLYDATTGEYLENTRVGVLYNECTSLAEMNIVVSVVRNTGLYQGVDWACSDPNAVIFYGDGSITGIKCGEFTITATPYASEYFQSTTYSLVISKIKTYGDELEYDDSLWNTEYVQPRTNCYAYALNNQIDPNGNNFGCNYSLPNHPDAIMKQAPGEFHNNNLSSYEGKVYITGYGRDHSLLINAVTADFNKYNEIFGTNLLFRKVNRDEYCPDGTYKVALFIDTITNPLGADFHWFRQDSDGMWSHKPATDPVTRLDFGGNLIYDIEDANTGQYIDFAGYFIVSAWNNMYIEPTLLMTCIQQPLCRAISIDQIEDIDSYSLGRQIDLDHSYTWCEAYNCWGNSFTMSSIRRRIYEKTK